MRIYRTACLTVVLSLIFLGWVVNKWPEPADEIPDFQIMQIPDGDWSHFRDVTFYRPTFLLVGDNVTMGSLTFLANHYYPSQCALRFNAGHEIHFKCDRLAVGGGSAIQVNSRYINTTGK